MEFQLSFSGMHTGTDVLVDAKDVNILEAILGANFCIRLSVACGNATK